MSHPWATSGLAPGGVSLSHLPQDCSTSPSLSGLSRGGERMCSQLDSPGGLMLPGRCSSQRLAGGRSGAGSCCLHHHHSGEGRRVGATQR